ncbi:MAG TPA: hypothetical protein VIY48_12745 [Candidatus Paceibacterota bacterium]
MSVETEVVDVSPVDAALIQDEFDRLSDLTPEPAPEPEDVKAKAKSLVEAPEKMRKETPKSGPPSIDEWQAFIGRFVIRTITDAYLSLALRDIEDELSPRELEMIRLTKEDLKDLSAPLATLANKSTRARKHGRAIIAAADSYESVIAMAMWMRRVNKIAKKHRKAKVPRSNRVVQGQVQEENANGYSGSNDGQGPEFNAPGFGVFNPGSGG